jgi:hypothetical protein
MAGRWGLYSLGVFLLEPRLETMEERQMELFRDFVIDKVSVELPADNLSKLLRVGVFTTKQMCEGFLTITVSTLWVHVGVGFGGFV